MKEIFSWLRAAGKLGTFPSALALILLTSALSLNAQDAPKATQSPESAASSSHAQHGMSGTNAPLGRVNPYGSETDSLEETLARRPPEPSGLYPGQDWPPPVEDNMKHYFFLADVLEYRPAGNESDTFWDIESWYGGDFNRLWFKSEGTKSTEKSDYDLDFQLLYGRFIKKYYDFQIGLRGEAREFLNRNILRGHAVIGIEGVVPYRFTVEPLLFISQDGDISFRFTATRDMLLTQKLILEARFETKIALQEVERFAVGSGLNEIEVGLRLRYEIRREFAPYIGVAYDQSFFGTRELIRAEGSDPSQVRFVAGVRLWF